MKRCAFLTMDDLSGFVAYDALVRDPLARRGWSLDEVSWRSDADWSAWDLVVIRTPWDYQNDVDAFYATLARIAAATRLENPLDTVRWNLRKTYLRDLEARGVTLVPTEWLHAPTVDQIAGAFDRFDADGIVVKPVVGANADDALRIHRSGDENDEALEVAARLFRNRDCMVQPFVQSVVDEGEWSLVFFDGEYSHTILKTPKDGDFRVQEEHGGRIRGVAPDRDVSEAAARVLEAVTPAPLYARVDLVRLGDGTPALMELELIEPSLYFPYDDASADRFAAAIARR